MIAEEPRVVVQSWRSTAAVEINEPLSDFLDAGGNSPLRTL